MGFIALLYIKTLPIISSLIVVLTCSAGLAQTYTADKRYPDAWNGDPELDHAGIESGTGRGLDRLWTIRQQSPVSAVVTMHELAHRIPKQAERDYRKAWVARDKGDLQTAILDFQKAIAIDPEFHEALNDLGTTYLQLNQIDLAIEQFNKAMAADPHAAKPCSNLAIAYLRSQQYADAERAARRVLDLDRAGTHGLLTLGISLVLQEKFTPEMRRSLERAALDHPAANFWLGIGLLNAGEIETARDRLKAYLARGEESGRKLAVSLVQEIDLLAQSKQ
jgi:Flp pilus assembly protein TadD